MRLRLGYPRSALIIAPHPDDEAIAACLLIIALRRRGTRVAIVIVTDGAASHPGSVRWPPRRLAAERKREARRAARRLGVPASCVEFLGLADGALGAETKMCTRHLARTIARRRNVRLLVAPAADDVHPDHRVIASAIDAAPFAGRRLRYRVWPPRMRSGERRCLAAPGLSQIKRSIVRGYRTQSGAITDSERGFTMSRREFTAFTRPIEHFVEGRR